MKKDLNVIKVNNTHNDNNTDDALYRLALLEFQTFMGIPKTRKLDNETIEIMKKPRCARPDKTPINFSNSKLRAVLTSRGRRKRRQAKNYFSKN